ncbi:GNAT family N-acetyltransferase [Asticcacaulis sp.]|uniref:GNAT family N-acetyltransferase n=1 Tax=Asticcacaulis sp. TaxID=1872648 RepID=UPI002D0343FA|nr:GNAT family N-acetyltransferase [Asticcacaulis sp.]HTM81864.1 GNAT family N-acetyltransferase [Asticcacaulis sp.]
MPSLEPPRPLSLAFDISDFDCGVPELNLWLKQRALSNEALGTSRTFVVSRENRVVGYYALTVGSIMHAQAPGKIRRNIPDPVPAAILGRLATDLSARKMGLGGALLIDAIRRTLTASETLGIRAMLIHALSEEARAFYERYHFIRSPADDMMLIATMSDLRKALS